MTTKRTYKNKTSYNRAEHNKDNPYVCISSTIYQDKRLGGIEIAIMLYLLSNADSFIVNKVQVQNKLKIGRIQFNNSWEHLKSTGYINKEIIQGGIHWTINEDPLYLTMSESCSSEDLTMTGFGSTESSSTGSGSTGNDHLTSTNSKLVLNKTNTKNKLPSLGSEEVPDTFKSKKVERKKSYQCGGLAQQFRDHLGVPSKPFNGFNNDVTVDVLKPVDSPKKKNKAAQFEEWYDSYPSRGNGQIKGNRRQSELRFKMLSDSQVANLMKATKMLKFINVPDDPKYYSYSEKFILDYQDILDANPIDLENRNIDNGSGFFEI